MFDFSKINSFDKGQRESFEELMCVLALRNKPIGHDLYQRIEGSGGDGGVEALWVTSSGAKTGYQAKYFLKLGNSQWAQIDKSVRRALEVHPEITRYIVAFPCNFTHKKTFLGLGASSWGKWDASVEKWKEWAKTANRTIEFEAWTETTLNDYLTQEQNIGLANHWFGEEMLSFDWFKAQVDSAVSSLEERYNPVDHVETNIEQVFDIAVRGRATMAQIKFHYTQLKSVDSSAVCNLLSQLKASEALINSNRLAWNTVLETESSFSRNCTVEWNVETVIESILDFHAVQLNLSNHLATVENTFTDRIDIANFKKSEIIVDQLQSSCLEFLGFLRLEAFKSEMDRAFIISGISGSGKSHLFGRVAEQSLNSNRPTILLLGQHFTEGPFWSQFSSVLNLQELAADELLATISAAAERSGERAIILIDAVNEGVGGQFWKNNLVAVLQKLQSYPHVITAISCRIEYLRYAIPASVLDHLQILRINGFETQAEMENAARVYLDGKGISRPNTPWLSPELSNPLFLKSVSEAMEAKGLSEFPRGLRGISEILAIYLDSIAYRFCQSNPSINGIASAFKASVNAIARQMASTGEDYVDILQANKIINDCFALFPNNKNTTWLEELFQLSILRRDLPPRYIEDPLNPPTELVRFAFQRFQDHLMATQLLNAVDSNDIKSAFESHGVLNFLFEDIDNSLKLSGRYAGLVSALSILFPEKFQIEFVHGHPSLVAQWKSSTDLQVAFSESVKWREADTFSKISEDLLHSLNNPESDMYGLLVETSTIVQHPWNALFLHKMLIDKSMAERDAGWTVWANQIDENSVEIERIISWIETIKNGKSNVQHCELAGITLSWLLTVSNRLLRDRTTKALTTLFLQQYSVFPFLLKLFANCNDPYVLERLLSAGFGASCLAQNDEMLVMYSQAVYDNIFSSNNIPVAILARDYAAGIVELAEHNECLSSSVEMAKCLPPYMASAPIFELDLSDIQATATSCGGEQILRSASSGWGDFGKYTIPGRVRTFLTTPIDQPIPISKLDVLEKFKIEVIEFDNDRRQALEQYEGTMHIPIAQLIGLKDEQRADEQDQGKDSDDLQAAALQSLKDLLDPAEQTRLDIEFLPNYNCHPYFDSINLEQCRLWITARAYSLGWTATLFPNDGSRSNVSRYETSIERIGKKYQRIALGELQARLADNFWCLNDWPEIPTKYQYSSSAFRRDIEPTILPLHFVHAYSETDKNNWMYAPEAAIQGVTDEQLREWPFSVDRTKSFVEKLARVDDNKNQWLVLYEFSDSLEIESNIDNEHSLDRMDEFRFFYCLFVQNDDVDVFTRYLDDKQSIDVSHYAPRDVTDGPFLHEAYWRGTWKKEMFGESQSSEIPVNYAVPLANYQWESHLDKTLPNGFSTLMPESWFAQGLSIVRNSVGEWSNDVGEVVMRSTSMKNSRTIALINENALNAYCQRNSVTPVWVLVSERNSRPDGEFGRPCCRRAEGAAWQVDGRWESISWNHDEGSTE